MQYIGLLAIFGIITIYSIFRIKQIQKQIQKYGKIKTKGLYEYLLYKVINEDIRRYHTHESISK